MILLLLILFLPVDSALTGGTPCALHSQCESGKCLGYCCNSPATPHCNFCYGDGKCGGCEQGWEMDFYRGICRISHSPGANCVSNSECDSSICKTHCCVGTIPHCIDCTTRGGCSMCENGYYLDPDTRLCVQQRDIGRFCERFVLNQCKTKCRERCCDLDSLDPNCGECDIDGKCIACNYGYKWMGDSCRAVSLRPGGSCQQDSECYNGKCLSGHCCNQPGCIGCTKYGTCETCKKGFLLKNGICQPPTFFSCARTWGMIQKRYCNRPKKLEQYCCWMCDQPCQRGLKCIAINERKGKCVYSGES